MGFETLLLLCDVLRRDLSARACVCAVFAHLLGVTLPGGHLGGRSVARGSPGGQADPGKGFSAI